MTPQQRRSSSALTPSLGSGSVATPISTPLAACLSIASRLVSTAFLDVLVLNGVSLAQWLTTSRRQRDAACQNLVAVSNEPYRLSNRNDKLLSATTDPFDSVQMSCSSMLNFPSKRELISAQLPPNDVDSKASEFFCFVYY